MSNVREENTALLLGLSNSKGNYSMMKRDTEAKYNVRTRSWEYSTEEDYQKSKKEKDKNVF
ncbi:hypothetical protein P4644_16105 [Priestia aryabhattai]|uniref:hypothetical protein n=1 Tax=Priestia aryabhattai TaxID=412384 RepID=UPI002E21FCAE|nr:hypothetical protein [Priestia aryabhattai]